MGVVIITGCSRGIGRHAALALAARGWTVVGTLRSDAGRDVLEGAGVEVEHLDVTDAAGAAAVVDAVLARHGRLDAVVANAGRGLFGCFEDVDDTEIRALFDVNLFGAMHIVRAALPALRAARGKVVLVSSIAGRRGAPGSGSYNATKFALEGWGEALRYELAPFGVSVTLVEPGATESGFLDSRGRGARVGGGVYAGVTARLQQLHAELTASREPVDVVVEPLVRILEADSPPLRVPTGRSTRWMLLAGRLLPWRVYDALVRRKLRLYAG